MGLDQIIADCKKKCSKTLEQLYLLFSKKLFGVCLKYYSNYGDAQDNLHDGFIIIFNKIEQFTFKGSFKGWAKKVIINNELQKSIGVPYLKVINDTIVDENIEIEDENIAIDYLLQIIQELPNQY